jgi:hypothetical protein
MQSGCRGSPEHFFGVNEKGGITAMSDYLIYLNKRLVTTISLSTFPCCHGEAVATRHARQLFSSNNVRAVLVR